MENKDQYNQPPNETTGTVTVPKPGLTKTPTDRKIEMLEEQLLQQHKELLKLRRDIGRLKDQLGEVTQVLNRRG